jgi:two-component system nitrate/nitrite response regulator NarL
VLVVAQVRLYRDGLAQALTHTPDLRVLAAVATPESAASGPQPPCPDVVLVDVSSSDGPAGVRALRDLFPESRLVALGVADDEDQILAIAEAGVAGFVTRDTSLVQLVATIHGVMRDQLHCSPRMTAALVRRVGDLASGRDRAPARHVLTPRQAEVLGLIEQGLSNKQIAAQLSIELPTVKNHVHSILDRLEVSRRGQAASRVRVVGPAERSSW